MKKIIAILLFATSSAFAGNIIVQSGAGTITGVTAGTGISGGGTTGNVTVTNTGALSVSTTSVGGTPITGAVQLLPGSNVTLTQSGQGITLAATAGSSTLLYSSGTKNGITTAATSGGGSGACATSDTAIYDSGALPALAAGACMNVVVVSTISSGSSGSTMCLWYGTSVAAGSSLGIYNSTSVRWKNRYVLCNNSGSQTAQTVLMETNRNGIGVNDFLTGTMSQTTTGGTLHLFITNATNNGGSSDTTWPIQFQVTQ